MAVPVRFLARFDSLLMAQAPRNRIRVLPEGFRPEVFQTRNGQVLATYLIDGMVAGIWEVTKAGGRGGSSCARWPGSGVQRREVEAEAEAVARFLWPRSRPRGRRGDALMGRARLASDPGREDYVTTILTRPPPTGDSRGRADRRLPAGARARGFLDDREISLQKQSRVFFQISGAGHEALLLGPRPLAAARLRLVLPVLPRPLAGARPRRHADRDPPAGRRLGRRPGVGRPADAVPLGPPRERTSSRSRSATGSQCIPAVGCAEATRYIQGRDLPGVDAHGDEITYVSLGEGATMRGRVLGVASTPPAGCTCPILYVVADNGYAISVRAEDQSPAPISEMVRGFRGLAITKIDGRDYFQARHFGARAIARVRAGEGPGLIHAKVTRPYSHSAADTQTKYRSPEELADEAAARPDPRCSSRSSSKGGVLTRRRRRAHPRRGARTIVADGRQGGAGRAPARPGDGARPRRTSLPADRRRPVRRRPTTARSSRSARRSGARCTS